MATRSNRFEQVDEPGPDAVTVTLWSQNGQACGRVLGPVDPEQGEETLAISGQDRPFTAFQALVTGCHLANEMQRKVVIVDPDRLWRPEWGQLRRD